MSEQEDSSVDLPSSSLSHRELRMLCLDADLPISGKKSVLIERLLDAGHPWEDLGLESSEVQEETELILNEDELILEETESFESTKEIAESEDKTSEIEESDEKLVEETTEELDGESDEELDEEIFEAEIIEAEIQPVPTKLTYKAEFNEKIFTNLTNPKAILTFVIVGLLIGSIGWYIYSQPDPFSPDKLRYGDSMTFSISGGQLQIEGDELVEQIAKQLGAEDQMCGKIEIDYAGSGSVSVIQGESIEISNQADNSKLGAVQQKGPFGESWLTLEQRYEFDFDDVDIETNTPIANKCSETTLGNLNDNQAKITVDSWTELRNQELLRSDISYEFQGGDLGSTNGKAVTYGVENFGEVLQNIMPGITLAFAPIELDKLLEGAYLSEGVSGEKWNWNWTVAGTDEVAGKETWKIYLENTEISDRCFGSAKINLWASKDSPWPVKQYVDLRISNFEEDRTSCSKSFLEEFSTAFFDFEIPQGRLNLQMMMIETSSESGGDLVDWKETYSNRPSPGQGYLNPTHNWNNDGSHMPDNSTLRSHTIEDTIKCINETIPNSEILQALDVGGYIWRAIDDRSNNPITYWNFSWVDPSDKSGWAFVEIWDNNTGGHFCEIDEAGLYESQTIIYNSDSISITNSLAELENRILNSNKFPELSGTNGIIAPNGELDDNSQIGYLVITPSENLNEILDLLNRDEGAVSFDIHRSYEEDGWDVSVELLVDATNGRIIGWTQTSKMNN